MADAYYNDAPNAMLGNPVHSVVSIVFDVDDIRIIGSTTRGPTLLTLLTRTLVILRLVPGFSVSSNLTTKTVGVVGDGIWDFGQ